MPPQKLVSRLGGDLCVFINAHWRAFAKRAIYCIYSLFAPAKTGSSVST
ncbi:MAG: hypothetical protein JXJ22_04680 [Bacteroidales bacterium]|nr:hypothetical protein [Bacteroidales bacterium]